MTPLSEYTPDQPTRDNALVIADNCIPLLRSYAGVQAQTVVSDAIDTACRGAHIAYSTDGTIETFAGDADKLYKLSTLNAWENVTRGVSSSEVAYTMTGTDAWQFAQWGDVTVACNGVDVVQKYELGTDTEFSALTGSPPVPRYMGVVRDFLVTGNLSTDQSKLQWSGLDDITTWTPSATTQADSQVLVGEGGDIQAISGGEYGVIFQERSIWRMTYVGPPLIFQFDEVERGRGTSAPRSVVNLGAMVFYLGHDGFYVFDGSSSTNIGTDKVDRTFLDDLDPHYYENVVGVVDPTRTLVYWSYPGSGNSNGIPNRIICYNWSNGKWSTISAVTEYLFVSRVAASLTMDNMDSTYPDLDAIPFSFDSSQFAAGSIVLASFDVSHKLAAFTGADLEAQFQTGEGSSGDKSYLSGVRPLFEGAGSATVAVGTRNNQTAPVAWGAAKSPRADTGLAKFRQNYRYISVNIKISGGFDHAYGYDLETQPTTTR